MIRIKSILCPVDFFPASERAASHAIALAQRHGAKLTLLHVVTPVMSSVYDLQVNNEVMIEAMTDAATSLLNKLAKRARSGNISVQTVVRFGFVDMEIQAVAATQKADFIVMGTHGQRGFEQWFIGSVTERVLRRTSAPLLTMNGVTRRAPAALRRILVATDFSKGTSQAVDYACTLAHESRARITILHVLNDIDGELDNTSRAALIRRIRVELAALVPKEIHGGCRISAKLETGVPYKRILEILKDEKIDLIVMNIHGKGFLDRALIGSTAERIVRGAECPVLMIPAGSKSSRRSS